MHATRNSLLNGSTKWGLTKFRCPLFVYSAWLCLSEFPSSVCLPVCLFVRVCSSDMSVCLTVCLRGSVPVFICVCAQDASCAPVYISLSLYLCLICMSVYLCLLSFYLVVSAASLSLCGLHRGKRSRLAVHWNTRLEIWNKVFNLKLVN